MAEPVDVFAVWERQFYGEAPAARPVAPLWFRLLLGAILGFTLAGTTAFGRAALILHQVFGETGGYVITARLLIYSLAGGALGTFIGYAWPQLTGGAKRLVAMAVAIVLIGPGALQYKLAPEPCPRAS
ncbi:MAG: hypothetical protein DLM58_19665 [Pseudonocardiales bacterium]|nr:MAG: hypothetical protein DLM58_19665 [Pseudonocardiales bacterium]